MIDNKELTAVTFTISENCISIIALQATVRIANYGDEVLDIEVYILKKKTTVFNTKMEFGIMTC